MITAYIIGAILTAGFVYYYSHPLFDNKTTAVAQCLFSGLIWPAVLALCLGLFLILLVCKSINDEFDRNNYE